MHKNRVCFVALPVLALLAACSDPEPEAVSEPQPADEAASAAGSLRGPGAGGVDPTVADPDHYTAEFENEAVRILRIKYDAGDGSVMHYHPDSVAVFLTDGLAQMTMSDGSAAEVPIAAGEVEFSRAGEHQPKNIGQSSWEVVEIELKPRSASAAPAGGPDPVTVDPDHYSVELENEAVRVLRIKYGDGEESVMHYHPDGVAVFLNDHLAEMQMPDGSTTEISAAAGDAMFVPGGQHLPKNISGSGVELVLVELK